MNEKKRLLVETAMGLFYDKGIHAVGINEIIKSSGVAKRTLYHHFDSKEALIMECLAYRDQNFIQWFISKIEQGAPGKEAIFNIFNGLDQWFNDQAVPLKHFRGCFFINTTAEYSDPESGIFKLCQQHKQAIRNLIRAQVALFVDDAEELETLTDSICILKDGCICTALIMNDLQAAIKVKPILQRLIG
jgi:AcrR family transcriptional regulator